MSKQIGISCVRGCMAWEECRQCRLNPLRPCHYTPDLLGMIERRTTEHPAPTAYTPSRMCGCDRQTILMGEGDYYEDYQGAWPLVRGTLVHAILEAGGTEIEGYARSLRELRLRTTLSTGEIIEQEFDARDSTWVSGQEPFTGKPDLLLLSALELPAFPGAPAIQPVKIVDYKTSVVDHALVEAKQGHRAQLNMYAWLVRRALPGYLGENIVVRIDELEIIYMGYNRTRRFTTAGPLTDIGPKRRGQKEHEVLQLAQLKTVPDEVTEAWIRKRVSEKKAATMENLPPILEGDAAWLCRSCSVRDRCYSIARKEGEDE